MSSTAVVSDDPQKSSWFIPNWLSWNQFSEVMLRTVEKKILSYLKTAYRGWYVDIGPIVGLSDKIWTISLNSDSQNTPLLLLHGLGAGVGLWCLNLDALASNRPVYAIDLLGFGRSSRPSFSHDALQAEQQFVRSIEEWRREMNLEKVILMGHSFGGFLAASYSLTYPEKVKHLILADPWGIPEKPAEMLTKPVSPWVKAIAYALSPFNPFAVIRVAGPWGQWVIDKARPDLSKKFSGFIKEEGLISQYIYQCNSQTPSGESAFRNMMAGFGWAKNPMIQRIDKIHQNIPITILYGSRSWVDESAGAIVKEKRTDSYVQVQMISGAGHHVYADKADTFNKYVVEACNFADGLNQLPTIAQTKESTESDIEEEDTKIQKQTHTSIASDS